MYLCVASITVYMESFDCNLAYLDTYYGCCETIMFTGKNEKDSVFFRDNPLKGCPFCGGEPHVESCDRLIQIGCKKCNYSRHWHGLVQSDIITDVIATYSSESKKPIEWYDKNAYVTAANEWNKRSNS